VVERTTALGTLPPPACQTETFVERPVVGIKRPFSNAWGIRGARSQSRSGFASIALAASMSSSVSFGWPASAAAGAPLGITLAPKNHPPDPIGQFAPHLEAGHRLLIFKAEVIGVRVAKTWTSILKIWRRKFGVSHLSFSDFID
jgi:hypothetical protein